MSDIKIYGKSGCNKCEATKAILEKANVSFEYVDVLQTPGALDEIAGVNELPVIMVGCCEVHTGFKSDELADIIERFKNK